MGDNTKKSGKILIRKVFFFLYVGGLILCMGHPNCIGGSNM